jgi:hypothetical protein
MKLKKIPVKPRLNAGSVNGAGITAVEEGDATNKVTTLNFSEFTQALTDEAGVVAYGGSKVYDMPEGAWLFQGAVANLTIRKTSAGVNKDFDGDFSLGTVTASNNATLASTEQNFIPTTATPQAVNGRTTATGVSTSTEAPKIFDGSATATDIYLNFLVDDADQDVTSTACNLIVNGKIKIVWTYLGDI